MNLRYLSAGLVIFSCVVCGSLARAQTALPGVELPNPLGVNIHFTDPQVGEMEMLNAGGFRWVRMDFAWGAIERAPGQYDFSAYDRLMATLDKQQMRALFILDYGNPLYDNGLSPHTEVGRAAFARWAVAAALHFKGRGILWEMFNEPNGGFWKPQADVEDYAKLALAVGKALRAAKPTETYIGPATSGIDFAFLEGCFKAGLLEYWSAVSVHPYRQERPESAAPEYRRLRQLIAKYAPVGKHIPIISGEWGYSSVWSSFDAAKQGKFLPREWLTNLANDIPLSIWYDWHDDGLDPKDPEHHFGSVLNPYLEGQSPVYTPKPAYLAAKTLASALAGYHFNKRLIVGDEGDYALLFSKGNEVRAAVWTTARQPHPVHIPASPGPFLVTGHTGAQLAPLTANGSGLAVTLTDAPQYLVPEGANELLRRAAAWERLPLEIVTTAPQTISLMVPKSLVAQHSMQLVSYPGPNGQTLNTLSTINVSRAADTVPVQVTLTFPDSPIRLVQETQLVVTNALHITILPGSKGAVPVRLDNPSGSAFKGTMRLVSSFSNPIFSNSITLGNGSSVALGPPDKGTETPKLAYGTEVPLVMRAGQTEQTVLLHRAALPGNLTDVPADLKMSVLVRDDKGHNVLSAPLPESHPFDDFAKYPARAQPPCYTLVPDGDAKIGSAQTVTVATPPDGMPMPGMSALKITYRFDAGWKFIRLTPATDALKGNLGQPKALGLWIYGDGSGNQARLRFTDSTGQTFQPGGEALKWKGWRYVTFPLDGTLSGSWGGQADGIVHAPIHFDTLFLLDSANRQASAGTVYISSPTLIY